MTERPRQAQALLDWMIGHRRHLHRNPEVGLQLPDTHAYVAEQLRSLGLDPEVHPAAGVTVRLPGHAPDGTTSVLRVDMDALPVHERSGATFASERAGAMHACGHDLHTATGLGAARALTEHAPTRDTVLVFQPGEETDRGAVATLAAHSALQLDGPATAFAVHVHAVEPVGSISWTPDTFMAFGDWFTTSFSGPGGHASQPHLAGNPIDAGAEFVRGAREIVGRLGADEHVVASVTEFLMGSTVNVFPAEGRLRGTIRTLSGEQRTALITGLRELVDTCATGARVRGTWTLHEGYPAVVNDAGFVAALLDVVGAAGLGDRLQRMTAPSMVIEDFSYFLQRWPGAMVYVGANVAGHTSFNHADDVVFDEAAMATSLALYLLAADAVDSGCRTR